MANRLILVIIAILLTAGVGFATAHPAVAEHDENQHHGNNHGKHGDQNNNSSDDDKQQVTQTALESRPTPPDVQGLWQRYISEFAIGTTTLNASGLAISGKDNEASLHNAALSLKGVIYRNDENHDMSFLEGTLKLDSTTYQIFAEGTMKIKNSSDVNNLFITGKASDGGTARNLILRFLVIHDKDGSLMIIGDPAGRVNPDTRLYAMVGKLTVSFSASPPSGNPSSSVSLDQFEFGTLGNQQAGQGFNFTVKAIGSDGTIMTNYNGTVTLATNDGSSPRGDQPQISPASYTFAVADHGIHSFSAKMYNAQSGVYMNATGSGRFGESTAFAILPGQVATLTVMPTQVTLAPNGLATFNAKAFDQFSNPILGQTFLWSQNTSAIGALSAGTDSSIEMLQAPTMTTGASGNVTARADGSALSASALVHVNATAVFLDHLAISNIPSNQTAGQQFSFTVTAIDNFGHIMTGFNGRVNVTTTDGTSISGAASTFSPQSYVFQSADAGQHVFSATMYNAKDGVTVTASGWGKNVTSNAFRVVPGIISTVHVIPNPIIENANATTTINATATDAYGNTVHTTFIWAPSASAPGILTVAADTQSATFKAGNVHVQANGTLTVSAGGISTVVPITVNP